MTSRRQQKTKAPRTSVYATIRRVMTTVTHGLVVDALGLGHRFGSFEIDVCSNRSASTRFCGLVKQRPDVMEAMRQFIARVIDADTTVVVNIEKRLAAMRSSGRQRYDVHAKCRFERLLDDTRREVRERAHEWAREDADKILADIHHAVQEKIRASV